MYNLSSLLVVKWISSSPPKAVLQVRFLSRGPNYLMKKATREWLSFGLSQGIGYVGSLLIQRIKGSRLPLIILSQRVGSDRLSFKCVASVMVGRKPLESTTGLRTPNYPLFLAHFLRYDSHGV